MRVLGAVTVMLLVAGCGAPAGPSNGHDLLYDASSERIAVVDSQSHQALRSLPLGVATTDWSHLYSAAGGSLVDTDPSTGAVLRTLPLPAGYQLPTPGLSAVPVGLSENGRWLVLDSSDTSSGPPSARHFLVVDTRSGVPVHVDLDGRWEFDAIGNDGARLYLLEYLGASSYRVRVYLVSERMLDPQVVVDKSDAAQPMAGVRLTGVGSTDGRYEYTVYGRPNGGAFIHALMLDGSNVAWCLELPGVGFQRDAEELRWSLVMNTTGSRLYAVNAALGTAVEVAIGTGLPPTITRTVHFQAESKSASILAQDVQAKEFGSDALVVSPDGRTIVAGGADGIVWIDVATLSVHRHALAGWAVWTLGLSPDGHRLYAVRDDGRIAQLAMDSGAVIATFDPLAGQPVALLRVASL